MHSLHLAGLDIGSLSRSKELIKAFVQSMIEVMYPRIERHLHEVHAATSRKRLFEFIADKVTELHRPGYAVVMMVMSDGGELQAIFGN